MKTFQVNITSQHHRNKLRDTVVNWSIEDKIDLFKYLYISMVDLKRINSIFKCTMSDSTGVLVDLNIKRCTVCHRIKSRDLFWKHGTNVEGLYTQCIDCSRGEQRRQSPSNRIKQKIRNQDPRVKLRNAEYAKRRKQSNGMLRLRSNFSSLMSRTLKKYTSGTVVKNNSCFYILDYSIGDLVNHLTGQFTEGMTWDNYGEWHIDHIYPVSRFNITSLECSDFKKCWSLTNLQPLWAVDNLKKSDKII